MKKTKILGALVACGLLLFQSCSKQEARSIAPGSSASLKSNKKVFVTGVSNGRYTFRSQVSYPGFNRVLENAAGAGSITTQVNSTGANSQKYDITYVETVAGVNYYKIINVGSGLALDIFAGSVDTAQYVRHYAYTGAQSQRWRIDYTGAASYTGTNSLFTIRNKNSGLYLNLVGNSPNTGTLIEQQTGVAGTGKNWYIQDVTVADDIPPVDATTPTLNIAWAPGEGTKISDPAMLNARYGRVHRVNATTLLLSYYCYNADGIRKFQVRRSTDNGVNWTTMLTQAPTAGYSSFWAPDFIVLANGTVILAFTALGAPDNNDHDNVQIITSTNGGVNWSAPTVVGWGRSWEPAMIQLPDGEIEMFYSSEAPWYPTGPIAQEIRMIRSTDNGVTWTLPRQVAFNGGTTRDGMPFPLVLAGNKGIIFPIECVNAPTSPWMLWSSTAARWKYAGVGTTGNQRRWLVNGPDIWGGSPYMVQLTNGVTVLSCADDGIQIGRAPTDPGRTVMLVRVGNTVGKNFTKTAYPWASVPNNEGKIESSLFNKDPSNTVTAITSRYFPDNHTEVWWKDGTF